MSLTKKTFSFVLALSIVFTSFLTACGTSDISTDEAYVSDGETLTVYTKCEIDLAKLEHTEKEGYAFIGWQKKNGKSPESKETFRKGTVLTAQYAKIDFCIEDNAITEGSGSEHDLVFITSISKEFYNALPSVTECGTVYLPTGDTLGALMYLGEKVPYTWSWNSETGLGFKVDLSGRTPLKSVAKGIYKETENDIKYTLTVEDIDPDNYYTWYTARGYVIYKDYNGIERTVYTLQDPSDLGKGKSNFDKDQSCVYKVAKETPISKRTDLENQIIEYVEVDRKEYYNQSNGILEYYAGYSGMGLKDENLNHKIYKLSNGLVVRDVTVKTGISTTEKTEICFITDQHFAALGKDDIDSNITNALSSYRGRSWTRDTNFRNASLKYMEYASTFDKIVMGGDAVDYLTYGTLNAVSQLLYKKSVNGNITAVLGNHDPSETSQPDISGLDNLWSLEERYQMLSDISPNDVKYSSEIMTDKNGNSNIMLICLDNAGVKGYTADQLKKFKADIKTAREQNIPVLLFQHIPILTMNPEETEVYYSASATSFGSADNCKNGEVVDMTSYSGYIGEQKNSNGEYIYDETTRNLYNEIRKSADVIKGIFCGHTHENAYTEVVGLNEDGTANNLRIGQHNGYAAYFNGVMKITVE